MRVLHAAVFAQRQASAGGLQFLGALRWFFARLQASRCGFMGLCHGTVTRNILLDLLGTVLCPCGAAQTQGHDE
jgi:hypothetical protein